MALKPKIWTVVILALALSALSLPAAAQSQGGLSMKAQAAYQGYFKYGEWLPVWIELENQGAANLSGEVRVQISGSQGSTVFAAPVSLPNGSRKRFPLYILPNNFSREVLVSLISRDQALATEIVKVQPQPNISFFVGLVAPERGALGMLNGIVLPGQDRPKIITDVALADLPERPEALRSMDVLILNDTDTSRLTPDQASALLTWVQAGGRLVIGGGPGGMQTAAGLPEALLPVRPSQTVELNTEAIQDLARFAQADPILTAPSAGEPNFVACAGALVEGRILATGRAGGAEIPLLIERAVGSGGVDFVAFDLSAAPFNGWPGVQFFWEQLLGPGAVYPQNMPFDISLRQMRAQQLTYPLSNIPSLDLPSVQGLTLLLLVYIVMVGPLNYLGLRRLRKLHLAWVTIPAFTILFTAGAFGIGYLLRGTDLVVNKIAIVEPRSDGSAIVTSYMGLFSPHQQSYEILIEGDGLISPMNSYDNGWGMSGVPTSGGEIVFTQGDPAVIAGLAVNQFSMQSFMAEETWQDFGRIAAELRLENDVMVGVVRNETSYPISDVVVAIQSRFIRLGDLAAGQEAKVDLGLGNMQSERFGAPISYLVFQDRTNPNGMNSREVDLKINILSTIMDNQNWNMKAMISSQFPAAGGAVSSVSRSNPVTIFGWMQQAPPDVQVRNNRIAQQTTALVYTSANFQLPDSGPVSLPVGMTPGSLTQMPRDGGPCGPTNMPTVSIGNGEAEFEFLIPEELEGADVKAIKLNIWRDSGGDWALPETSFWDWQEEAWKSIQEPRMGVNEIRQPAALVNESGAIRVRLKTNANMYACYYLDMGIEADLGGQE